MNNDCSELVTQWLIDKSNKTWESGEDSFISKFPCSLSWVAQYSWPNPQHIETRTLCLSVICVIIASVNGLSFVQHQTITWANTNLLLNRLLWTNLWGISITTQNFFHKNAFENAVRYILAISFRPQCVNEVWQSAARLLIAMRWLPTSVLGNTESERAPANAHIPMCHFRSRQSHFLSRHCQFRSAISLHWILSILVIM